MKITKDIYLNATAEAMLQESTQKLFKAEPSTFDMFSLFAFAVFDRIDGKDINDDKFSQVVAEVITESLPDDITDGTMLKDIALIIFSLQIWTELEKLEKPDAETDNFRFFKSVLKSKVK